MRHYVLTLILSAFFLTSNGQEIIGDPIGGPKKPIQIQLKTKSGISQFPTFDLINRNVVVPVLLLFSAKETELNKYPYTGLTSTITISFISQTGLLTQITNLSFGHPNPQLEIADDCSPCSESLNTYSLYFENLIPIDQSSVLRSMTCDELNALKLDVRAELTFSQPKFPSPMVVHPDFFSLCTHATLIWPIDCTYSMTHYDEFQGIPLYCQELNGNETRSTKETLDQSTYFNLEGQKIPDISHHRGVYIHCQNGKSKIKYIFD